MPAPEYVLARHVLLDALEALHDHLENLILVGSQAVYLHTGDGTLQVPPMTTDGDLALDTHQLADSPEIAQTLMNAGFSPGRNPGQWMGTGDVEIDIMVAPYQAGTTSKSARAARIPHHAKTVGRIAHGLEPTLIDNTRHTIAALEESDARTFELRVANPAALIVAKAIKITERETDARHQPNRLKDKDALDTFRLLQAIDTGTLVTGFRRHQTEPEAARTAAEAITFITTESTQADGLLPRLAAQAAFNDPTIAPAFAALASTLVDALRKTPSVEN